MFLFPYTHVFYFVLGEAIEKMLQEKRISTKINYEVLKSLSITPTTPSTPQKIPDDISFVTPKKVDSKETSSVISPT